MARKQYSLTDATFYAVSGHEKEIATAGEWDPSYISQIKRSESPDPFPKFREFYRATAFGRGDTSRWRNELDAIDAAVAPKQANPVSISQMIVQKITADAESTAEIYKAIEDGDIDEAEANKILRVIKTSRDNFEGIAQVLHDRLAEIHGHSNVTNISKKGNA